MNKSVIKFAACIVFSLLLALGSTVAEAQSNAATLTGTVTDKTGALIAKASILVTDEASGVTRSTTSDGQGFFSLVGIPVGSYDVKVSAKGFNSLLRQGIAVHINDQIELKGIALPVASASASIVVTAEATELTPTTSGEVSYTISSDQIHKMNLEGRSAIELLGLVPGSGNTGNFNGTYNGDQAGFTQNASSFTVNGNRFDQVQIVSDGASVTDLNTAGGASVTPNVDMIAELKVQSAAYSSAQPNGPIVVSAETKAGGRDFHGEAYLSARHHIMDATDWQIKANGLPKPQTSLFYPGFNIGGPVLFPGVARDHQKLFFFAATEIAQQHVVLDPSVRKTAVPTLAMRNGDFSDTNVISSLSSATNGYQYWGEGTQVCQPWNYKSYCSAQGIISPSRIDPAGKILLNAFPLPNADPTQHLGSNLITAFTTSDPRNQEVLRMDYALSDSTHLFGRYSHENESVPWPYGPYNTWNNTPYPASQTGKNASNSMNLTLTNVLSSTLTNEASLAYTRFTIKQALANLNAVSRTSLNYPSSYANLFQTSVDIIPNVGFDTGGGLFLNGGEAPPYLSAQNNYTFNEALSKLTGTHLLQVGFYAQEGRFNGRTTGPDNGSVSTDTWSNGANSGNDWADLLTGNISNFSQSSSNITAAMQANRFDFFAQDTWKAASRLTLNYGLRIDHVGWWYDTGGRIAIFNPSAYVASSSITDYSGMQSHRTTPSVPLSGSQRLGFQLAPSAGFAYDLSGSGRTVVRGGFGTSYYNDPGVNAFSAVEAPPNFKVVSLYGSYTLSSVSQLDYSTQYPSVWGTANPSDHSAPVTYSWNMAVAHTFPGANKVEVNYVGNSSHNLVGYATRNVVPEGSETGPWYGSYYDGLYRPYKNYAAIGTHLHNLNSNYNALQLTVARQKGWLNYWGSYTFGKTLAYNAEDAFDMKRWYGPAPFDRTQILSFSYYLNLPDFGKKYLGGSKLVDGLVDGWHFSGIFQASSGGPIGNNLGSEYAVNRNQISIWGTISNTVGGTTNQYTSLNGAFADGTPDEAAVPKMICDPRKGLTKNQYFNATCFVAPSYLSNGTYRLPYIHGPVYINDSTGVFKAFGLGESRKLEIRGEVFNLFNHAYNEFIAYDPNMSMGFSAAGGATISPSPGIADNKTGHRRVQLTAKFYF